MLLSLFLMKPPVMLIPDRNFNQKAMDNLMQNRTALLLPIGFLPSVMPKDSGYERRSIVEMGNHRELLAKKGFYAELYQSRLPVLMEYEILNIRYEK